MMVLGLALVMAIEALILARLGPTLVLWLAYGFCAATGAQVYGVVSGQFPLVLYGRVTTAVNLMVFVGAFGVQWGIGGLLDGLAAAGLAPATALTAAFALLLALQAASVVPVLRRRPAA
jgi:hypothetical protein